MTDLFEAAEERARDNAPEISVSEISSAIKRALEQGFGRVRVRGEIGRVSRPRSGHVYLDLKEDKAVLSAVIWKGVAGRLDLQPTEGDEVVAEGRITTFGGQSKYQLVIDNLSHAGQGALLAQLERLKAALRGEGLFDENRKRLLPVPPKVLGVITSPSGAVIRDILHRVAERYPLHVIVWPVAVQGAACAPEVAAAIRGFDALDGSGPVPRPDALIVARGGGSLEDLWGFNDERVVRAASACRIPLVSAVGHETDWTLLDLVADRRAPTPTAAAEMLTPMRRELAAQLAGLEERRLGALDRLLRDKARRLSDLSRLLPSRDALLQGPRQRLDLLGEKLPSALRRMAAEKRVRFERAAAGLGRHALERPIERRRARLDAAAERLSPALLRRAFARDKDRLAQAGRLLETLGYKQTLARGYAVIRDAGTGRAIQTAAAAPDAVTIEFTDGRKAAQITGDGS